MLISLIIPIYNVEKYIEECLRSVTSQLNINDSVEVILVDDGSPDNSVTLVDKHLNSLHDGVRSKFILIRQENKGLSGARNVGIDKATGQYLAFLDSDDLLEHNFFDQVTQIIRKQSPDIIQFRASRFNDAGQVFNFLNFNPKDGLYEMKTVWPNLCNESAWFAWLRVYKRNLFNNIRYPQGKNYEDAYTTPYVFLKAQNIYFIDQLLIKYRMNPESITSKKSKKNIEDLGGAAFKMINDFYMETHLLLSALSLAQAYINDSLVTEGFQEANVRWGKLKLLFIKQGFDKNTIVNRGNKLFYNFGIYFLIFDAVLRRTGIHK